MTKTAKLRFRRQSIEGLAPHIRELHQAAYGGLHFQVKRRSGNVWPGGKIVAFVSLGEGTEPPYYCKVKSIQDGKDWCRGALSYILRGIVPFGDHSNEDSA